MIQIPRNKVAIIPVFDSKETRGGIIKAESFISQTIGIVYEIVDSRGKILEETDDFDTANKLIDEIRKRGYEAYRRQRKKTIEGQALDAGERCDQGVVKYIGRDVKDVQIGDYVFFSGYTGSLVYIEDEGKLIIMPENFIICRYEIDKFMEIPGIYFKDNNGRLITATYEQAMNIIAETFTDLGKTIEVQSEKPKLEEYNVQV